MPVLGTGIQGFVAATKRWLPGLASGMTDHP
jgi:hypothetical protein